MAFHDKGFMMGGFDPQEHDWTKDGEYTGEQLMEIADQIGFQYFDHDELIQIYDHCDDFEYELATRMASHEVDQAQVYHEMAREMHEEEAE